MTSLYNEPERLAKNSTNLSNLTKGIGELCNEEKKYDIIIEENDYYGSMGQKKALSRTKQEIDLPKTFTTKKGALILFSEDLATYKKTDDFPLTARFNEQTKSDFFDEEIPIKTVNELQQNVLIYGFNKNMKLPEIGKTDSKTTSDSNYLGLMSTKNLIDKSEMDTAVKYDELSDLKKINRGYSARRYLRNLTKNWDQDLLDTFISDGKLNEETIYEKKATKRTRAEEDLTILPQAYTFDQNWVSSTMDKRNLNFFNDFGNSKSDSYHFKIKKKSADMDPITIFKKDEQEISYDLLDQDDKQKVLSDLLFHSVMNNINQHQIGDPINSSISYTREGVRPPEKIEIHIKNFPEIIFDDASSDGASDSMIDKLNSDSDGFQKTEKSRTSFVDTVPKKTTLEPIYMFGKHSGAPWIKKQTENIPPSSSIANDLKSDSKILKPNSKIRKQLSKDEVIKDEPSPRSSDEKGSNIQESKTIRNKFGADLVQQEFKTIDEMFEIAAQDYELIEKSKEDFSLSKEDEPDQDEMKEMYLDEIRSIQEGYALEDVSHLNLAENRNLKSASTSRSNTKNKSILKTEKALEIKNQKNEVRFEKLPEKTKINQQSSNLFINEKIQNKDPNETKYKPDIKPRNSINDLEKHSVRVITVNNKKKTYKVDPKILKDMEHFGIKKFERFDTKKYDRQREKIFTDNSTNSKASWTRDTKFETSRPKGSVLSDEKWDSLNAEESFHPNSAADGVAQLAESIKRPLKPKIESVQQQNKLPKLKFLKSQDFQSESLTNYKQSSANSDSAYFDSDFAKVEMLRLRPKQNGGFAENLQSTKKERKELTSQMPNQATIYNFEEKEPYNPKKYDYSNILFKETTNLNRKDNNYLKTTSFKGLPSAEYRNEINTQRDSNVSTKTKANDNLKKRTINWAAGDFDPREFFMLWSYESPPAPIVVDRTFADTLRKYAEFIAKNVLNNKHAGMCLSDDIKRALRANLERLKQAIAQGKISREVLDEYKNIFKQVLAKTMKRKDLENVEIDDEMLMKLLELPARAFEVYIDPITGKESLRIKSAFLREQAKVIRTIVTEKPLSKDDFDEFIDPKTGEKKLKLRQEVAKKLGIPEDAEDLIEFYTDENGNQVMRLKDGARNVTIGDTIYELVTDADGKQVLKMTTKQKVGEEKLDDILRLADNMSPEAKNRYLQDLLKTGGGKMNDEIRKKLIDEMIKNAENLTGEAKENFLKDLMVNLVNELPPTVAKKVLSDIMKSTDGINTELKQQMIKNLIHDLNDLPQDLKEQALMELMKNMDNLSSEAKNNLLQDILTKVEETGGIKYSSHELRNQVLKEMLKNSQNLDEETRNKILHQVLDKITAEDGGDVPPTVLEELVKQMYNLPDSIKSKVLSEVTKNLEQGNLDSHVLSELLKHSDELAPEILAAIIKNTDKMESSTLKELVKHLDKIPDEFKQEIIGKMVNNLDEMDSGVKQELLKELMANPDLIQDEKLREKVLKDILSNLKTDDVIKETENMTAEEKNKYLQDLLKHSDNLSEETRQQIIGLLIKNAENLDQETKNNFLKDLIENIKELPPDLANKVLGDLMKNTNLLDADLKQKMIENLLNNLDDLPDELKQKALNEIAKNLDNLSAEKKEEIFKTILNNLDSLPDELKQETFKALIDNMNNLSSDQKNTLLQNILDKVEDDDSPDNEFKKNLKNEVLKEIVKNSQNLDEEQRTKILKDVMQKLKPGETVPDSIMNELVKQIDDLPDEIKSHVLNELKNSIENGNISGAVLDQMMKNPKNLPKDLLQKVVDNIKNLAPDALQKFVENLDSLPEDLKNKAVQDMLNNMDNIDPNVKKDLLKELVSKPGLIKDKKMMEKAIMDLVDNLEYMPENVKKDMLKDLAKNINNLSGNVKEKIIKEVFKNLTNSNDETREEIMKQLMKKMGADELEKWLENSDLPEEFKAKILADIEKIRNEGEDLLNSDDEKELEGLSGEERAVMKRRLIEKRKQIKHEEKSEKEEIKRDLNWLQKNKDNVLKNLVLDPDNSEINLNEEQIDFVRAFHKLSEEEKTKLLENMSEEERKVLTKLTEQYHDLRQKELQEALSEAKNLAIQKLRERLALQKRMEYLNFLKLESKMFDFAQQISRAFVFSYFEMLQWLEISF